jgi:hypothetical protein
VSIVSPVGKAFRKRRPVAVEGASPALVRVGIVVCRYVLGGVRYVGSYEKGVGSLRCFLEREATEFTKSFDVTSRLLQIPL